MITRQQIVDTALTYNGVKWKHLGRNRDEGVDCVGLIIAVAYDLEIVPPDFENPMYSKTPQRGMLDVFGRYCDRIGRPYIQDGSIAVFSYMGSPFHCGIVLNAESRHVIHALASARKCIVDTLDNGLHGRKFVGAWDFRGITHG